MSTETRDSCPKPRHRCSGRFGGYEQLLPNSIPMRLGDSHVRVIGLDDLITIKRALARPKDLDALQYLLVVKQLLNDASPGE